MSKIGPPPPAEVKNRFSYDSDTGAIFRTESVIKQAIGRADVPGPKGYLRVRYGRRYFAAHRIAWFLHYGVWPDCHVDHRDLDRTNNAIENLRLASPSESQCNRRKTGKYLKGVSASKNRFEARLTKNRKQILLGSFATELEAHEAYKAAAVVVHGEFARFE